MSSSELHNIIIEHLLPYEPKYIGLFGSFVRGENTAESDIDVLVSFGQLFGMLEYIKIERELSDKLGCKVDLLSERALKNEKLKQYIYSDLQIIFQE